MKPYSSYKDSGVEWIGEIPSHWEVKRLGMIGIFTSSGIDKKINENEPMVNMINYMDIYQDRAHQLNNSHRYMVVSCPQSKINEHQVNKGDLVFLPSSETKEDLGLSSLVDEDLPNTVFSYHLIRFQLFSPVNHTFRKYLCNNHFVLNQFSRKGKGTTRQIIGRNVFRNIRVIIPSESEQKKIVSFLDYKTQLIDELFEKTEQKIELLREKRTSLLNHYVTKGLNPGVEMKDSGVEWIGEIPSHWMISRLDFLCSIYGRVGWKALKADEYREEGYIFLATPNIKNKEIDFQNVNYISRERYLESPEIILNEGDILLAKDGSTLGIINVVKKLPREATVNSSIAVLKKKSEEFDSIYLYYFMSANYIQNIIQRIKGGMGVPHLFQADIKKFKIILPPQIEQVQIAEYLDKEINKIDAIIHKEIQRIALLKEYRQSLISEVVTGKIDVRDEVVA